MRQPNTGRGYDTTVRVGDLSIATRVAVFYNRAIIGLPDEIWYGTVLWIGAGSVELWWDHEKSSTRVQPDLDVYILEDEQYTLEQIEYWFAHNRHYGKQRPYAVVVPADINDHTEGLENTYDMAEINAASPVVKALIARWNFQIDRLKTALEGDDKAQASITMGRLEKVVREAQQMKVVLPELPEALVGYAPLMELLDDAKKVQEAKIAQEAQTVQRHIDREVAKEKHQSESKAAKPKSTGTSAPRPKKDAVLRPCLDGCGTMVKGNFAMGHDAKLKSLLIKIEKGEKTLEDIPEPCLDLVSVVKGDAIQDRDSEGKPKGEPKQTFVIKAAPVRFPGRDDIKLTTRTDE